LPNTLQVAKVRPTAMRRCTRDEDDHAFDGHFCAEGSAGQDACGGDSGGPVTHK
jgi:secreted trypsin-like serine protease